MKPDDAILKKFMFGAMRMRNLPWYPRKGGRDILAELFYDLGYTEGVEVGTNHGRFALTLCQKNPNLHLTCIDPWMAYQDIGPVAQDRQDRIYAEAVQTLLPFNVTIVRQTSMAGVQLFPNESLDFVYIDGNHLFDYVMMDIICWVPKVRKGGIVALHDYHSQVGADVIKAIDAYTHCHGINPWYVTREEHPTAYWVRK